MKFIAACATFAFLFLTNLYFSSGTGDDIYLTQGNWKYSEQEMKVELSRIIQNPAAYNQQELSDEINSIIVGPQRYTTGELIYQLGILFSLMCMFVFYRMGIEGWHKKLILNWFIEVFIIAIIFTSKTNPYSINWDKILFLQISLAGMVILYLTCYLFPVARKLII